MRDKRKMDANMDKILITNKPQQPQRNDTGGKKLTQVIKAKALQYH